jgi:IS5 family transposase
VVVLEAASYDADELITRCGDGVVAGLNEALLAKAAGDRLLRTARLRADT